MNYEKGVLFVLYYILLVSGYATPFYHFRLLHKLESACDAMMNVKCSKLNHYGAKLKTKLYKA